MTGPEHYREAEALLASASGNFLRGEDTSSALAAAQVHATLALAAVTVHHMVATSGNDREGWSKAIHDPAEDYDVKDSFG
ncbi:hypothetical protein AB0K87_01755 [Streptomyces sp. NPDC053705]|uniref:hypothetical protein n=1 Tax=Streptomyces sp. NPDC053705 TaxID=3156668 RepID=UPI00341C6F1A